MKNFSITFLFLITSLVLLAQEPANVCLSATEILLLQSINAERMKAGLDSIPYSSSLTSVGQLHCNDLAETGPDKRPCNMHSWSDKGAWTGCCYTADHRKAECMWGKPRELTNYQGDGFEIAFFEDPLPKDARTLALHAMEAWGKSPNHYNLIMNRKQWKKVRWKAMGVGEYGGYVCVWFGREADTAAAPQRCN